MIMSGIMESTTEGEIELRSGRWQCRVTGERADGSPARVELMDPVDGRNAISGEVPAGWRDFSRSGLERLALGLSERCFEVEGERWTAQVRAVPRTSFASIRAPGVTDPMVLFFSEGRACLTTFSLGLPLAEMTAHELAAVLRACLHA